MESSGGDTWAPKSKKSVFQVMQMKKNCSSQIWLIEKEAKGASGGDDGGMRLSWRMS